MADEPLSLPPHPIGDILQDALKRLVHDSRDRLLHAVGDGRARLRVLQLERDREAMWARLGKTAFRLVEAGELDHPALLKAIGRIEGIDEELDTLRGAIERAGPSDLLEEE